MKTPLNFLPIASGAAMVLGLIIIGLNHLESANAEKIDRLSRETAKKIKHMRLRANSRTLDRISSELRTHEEALEQLKNNNSSFQRFFDSHSC